MNPEDVLPPDPTPIVVPIVPPAPVPLREERNPTSVICEFCQCKITTARGQVLDRSPKALGYLDTDIVIRDLRRDSAAHQRRAEELQAKVNALENKGVAKLGL